MDVSGRDNFSGPLDAQEAARRVEGNGKQEPGGVLPSPSEDSGPQVPSEGANPAAMKPRAHQTASAAAKLSIGGSGALETMETQVAMPVYVNQKGDLFHAFSDEVMKLALQIRQKVRAREVDPVGAKDVRGWLESFAKKLDDWRAKPGSLRDAESEYKSCCLTYKRWQATPDAGFATWGAYISTKGGLDAILEEGKEFDLKGGLGQFIGGRLEGYHKEMQALQDSPTGQVSKAYDQLYVKMSPLLHIVGHLHALQGVLQKSPDTLEASSFKVTVKNILFNAAEAWMKGNLSDGDFKLVLKELKARVDHRDALVNICQSLQQQFSSKVDKSVFSSLMLSCDPVASGVAHQDGEAVVQVLEDPPWVMLEDVETWDASANLQLLKANAELLRAKELGGHLLKGCRLEVEIESRLDILASQFREEDRETKITELIAREKNQPASVIEWQFMHHHLPSNLTISSLIGDWLFANARLESGMEQLRLGRDEEGAKLIMEAETILKRISPTLRKLETILGLSREVQTKRIQYTESTKEQDAVVTAEDKKKGLHRRRFGENVPQLRRSGDAAFAAARIADAKVSVEQRIKNAVERFEKGELSASQAMKELSEITSDLRHALKGFKPIQTHETHLEVEYALINEGIDKILDVLKQSVRGRVENVRREFESGEKSIDDANRALREIWSGLKEELDYTGLDLEVEFEAEYALLNQPLNK